jgi:hypothetical protein
MSSRQPLLASTSPAGFRLIEWWAFTGSSNSLIGHATVEMPSGLIVGDIPAFRRAGGAVSVGVPSKPLVDANGMQLRDQDNRRRYAPTLDFATPAARSRWTGAIAALLEAEAIRSDK